MTHSTPGANLGTPAHGAPSDAKLLQEAVALAKSADTVVLALGNSREQEHEGIDRADISFPDNQVQICFLRPFLMENDHLPRQARDT